jgi:hypothetical protein
MAAVLFHRIYRHIAEAILRSGFQDGNGQSMSDRSCRGVWLSDVPWEGIAADENDALLQVTFTCEENDLAAFEWANDPPIGCREWLIPSAFIKAGSRVELLSMDEWDALLDAA